jgi:hypothetical protein
VLLRNQQVTRSSRVAGSRFPHRKNRASRVIAATASLSALRLGWNLEARGFRLEPAGDWLRVVPHTKLTPQDVEAIKAHRNELLAIVKYEAPEVVQ